MTPPRDPKRPGLPPIVEEETTGVQVIALRQELRHVAETQEIDVRQLHGRISAVAKDVTDLKVSNAGQTTTLTRIEKHMDEERSEARERRRIELESDHKIRVETAKIPRLRMTNRAKIILAIIALASAGIGAGVKLVAILHG